MEKYPTFMILHMCITVMLNVNMWQ